MNQMQTDNPFDFSNDINAGPISEAVSTNPEVVVRGFLKQIDKTELGSIDLALDRTIGWTLDALTNIREKTPVSNPNRAKIEDLMAKLQTLEELLIESGGKYTQEAKSLVSDMKFVATAAMIQ